MPRDEKGRFNKSLDLSLTTSIHNFKISFDSYSCFPWYKITTKADVLDLFDNKVLQEGSKCPKEKEVIVSLQALRQST